MEITRIEYNHLIDEAEKYKKLAEAYEQMYIAQYQKDIKFTETIEKLVEILKGTGEN